MASVPPFPHEPERASGPSRAGSGSNGQAAGRGFSGVGPGSGTGQAGSSSKISRIPPHNFEAEESLLGAMLLSRDAIAVAVEDVGVDDFYRPSHGHVFAAITSLYGRGEPADAVTVSEEMRRLGTLDPSGGISSLVSLQANTPAISSVSRYARIVQEHAQLRRLIGAAYEIAEIGYELPADVVAALDQAEALIFDVAKRRASDSTRALKDLLTESLEHLEYLANRDETITGVATGYHDLDMELFGLQPSNLVVVGARPSMGKTAFVLGMAAHAARGGLPVLFFSLEMSHLELAQRVLCAEARVDANRLRNGKLVDSDWPKISGAIGRVGTAPLYIDDNPNVTVMDIRAKARRMKSTEGGLGLVVVDYLQLMTGRSSAESRQVEISEISRGLKILARELSIPVVAASQLSRNLEARADKRPMLADLRECLSGSTKVARADTDEEVTLAELARSGVTNIPVWSLDESYRLVRSTMTEAWSTGTKPVSDLRLASGRALRLTANHPLLTLSGWVPAGDLVPGDRIAVARTIPREHPSERPDNEMIPREVWDHILKALPAAGLTARDLPKIGQCISRDDLSWMLKYLDDPWLRSLVSSDVLWDEVVSMDHQGEEEVFDACVPGTHSFIANGVVSHNSGAIEQDSDVVLFIYRDEIYNNESSDRGTAEILIAKHRNGPTGVARLSFVSNYARFGDLARM